MLKIRLFILFSFGFGFLLSVSKAHASEGIIEMYSLTDEPTRCWASSIRMQNFEYRIPFNCRYLIYPADEEFLNYVAWATPRDGGNVIKLGVLGLGRGEFKTKKPFTDIFITIESKKEVKKPQGTRVMEGSVEPIEFLEKAPSPTPVPEAELEEEAPQEEVQEEPKTELSTRDKLILALKRAGLAALVALVLIIGLIFVVTRSRR